MYERRRQRQNAVMAEIRRGANPSQSGPSAGQKPGESREAMIARQTRGWLFMRDLMSRTRAREDGTWYRDEREEPGSTP